MPRAPIPPRKMASTQDLLNMMSSRKERVTWSEQQVAFTLDAVYNELLEGKKYDLFRRSVGQTFVSIRDNHKVELEFSNGDIEICLNNKASGTFSPSMLPWKHRGVKNARAKILKYVKNYKKILAEREAAELLARQQEIATEVLYQTFPQALDKAFEKEVLEDSDGKENKEDK